MGTTDDLWGGCRLIVVMDTQLRGFLKKFSSQFCDPLKKSAREEDVYQIY